jgi:hypothetical protein
MILIFKCNLDSVLDKFHSDVSIREIRQILFTAYTETAAVIQNKTRTRLLRVCELPSLGHTLKVVHLISKVLHLLRLGVRG